MMSRRHSRFGTSSSSRSRIVSLFVALVLCQPPATKFSVSSALALALQPLPDGSVIEPSALSSTRILSIPLIPHHVQKRRRKRRRLSRHEEGLQETRRSRLGSSTIQGFRSIHEEDEDEDEDDESDETPASKKDHYHNGAAVQVAGLYQGYGTHYADLWCGTPIRQRQTVIVDTGSGVTAFPVVGCTPDNCGVPSYHINPLYDPSNSTSFERVPCNDCQQGYCSNNNNKNKKGKDGEEGFCKLSMSYAEGSSWAAYEGRDDCYVGGLHGLSIPEEDNSPDQDAMNPYEAGEFAFPLVFGCQTQLTGLFKTQLADGIMGMDQGRLAFWSQMNKKLAGVGRKFSLCFSRSPVASRNGTDAGAMTLGGTDERLHQTPMVYAAVGGSSGFYDVTIRQMYLRAGEHANQASSAEGGGLNSESAAYNPTARTVPLLKAGSTLSAIVDSGTTDSYFSQSAESAFGQAWLDMVGEAYSHSKTAMSPSELLSRPTLLVQLAGDETTNKLAVGERTSGGVVVGLAGQLDPEHPLDVILAIPPTHNYEYNEESDTYTARVYFEGNDARNVIGANAIMGHDVFFDVDNRRIGWSESDCNYAGLERPFLDGQGHGPASSSSPSPLGLWPWDDGCSSASCRLWAAGIFLLVGCALVAACVVLRRRKSRVVYDLAQANELELGGFVPSLSSDAEDNDNEYYSSHSAPYSDHEPSPDHFEIGGDDEDDEEEFHQHTNGVLS